MMRSIVKICTFLSLLRSFLQAEGIFNQTRRPQKDVISNQKIEGGFWVNMHLEGRLGNQMFQVAAALSLAEDYGMKAVFPDFVKNNANDLKLNYEVFFFFPRYIYSFYSLNLCFL